MDSTSSPLTGELPSPGMAEMQGFMRHLEELRAQNQALAEQLHQLRLQQQAQAPAPSQPVRNPILTPKPERYEGRGNLEGWISTTKDILVTCYNMDENSGAIVTTVCILVAMHGQVGMRLCDQGEVFTIGANLRLASGKHMDRQHHRWFKANYYCI